MSRKHYIRIAETLAKTLVSASDSQLSYIIVRNLCSPWVDYLASDNASFDPKRFVDYVWDSYSVSMGYEPVEK